VEDSQQAQSEKTSNADHRSLQEKNRPTTQTLHENLQRMRRSKRALGNQMPKVSQQKLTMEKARTRTIKTT
jgi:hypothetical protein